LLVLHFFGVALFAIYMIFRDAKLVNYPRAVVSCISVFYKACTVIFPFIFAELQV
jgi:squalene monooxygenase